MRSFCAGRIVNPHGTPSRAFATSKPAYQLRLIFLVSQRPVTGWSVTRHQGRFSQPGGNSMPLRNSERAQIIEVIESNAALPQRIREVVLDKEIPPFDKRREIATLI